MLQALRPRDEVFAPDEVMSLDRGATQADLEALSAFPELRAVSLEYCDFSYADLDSLARLRRLEVLDLQGLQKGAPKSAGLEWLDSLPKLRRLNLKHTTTLSPSSWKALEGCVGLTDLRLCEQLGTSQEEWLPSVLKLHQLYSLDASFTSLDDEGLMRLLEALPALRVLDISHTEITPEGSKQLTGRKWNRLQYFGAYVFDDDTLGRLRKKGSYLVGDEDTDFEFSFPSGD